MPDYFQRPEMPGVQFFRCDRYAATLSVPSCAAMWREGNHKSAENRQRCRTCALGAQHAGEATASMSPLMGTCTCARCHRPASRLISGHVCVSCKNREYELVKGRNAKGARPTKLQPLQPRAIAYKAADEVKALRLPLSADTTELMVAVLRDCRQRAVFGFHAAMPARRGAQMRLF